MSNSRLAPSGPFAPSGTTTLVAGLSPTIATPVPVGAQIVLTRKSASGAPAAPVLATWGALGAFVAADRLSFVIVSSLTTDVSDINWSIQS